MCQRIGLYCVRTCGSSQSGKIPLISNYERMCELFKQVAPDHARFQVVCGVDAGMMNFVIVKKHTYTYTSYMTGFDKTANELVAVTISPELDNYADPIYFKHR